MSLLLSINITKCVDIIVLVLLFWTSWLMKWLTRKWMLILVKKISVNGLLNRLLLQWKCMYHHLHWMTDPCCNLHHTSAHIFNCLWEIFIRLFHCFTQISPKYFIFFCFIYQELISLRWRQIFFKVLSLVVYQFWNTVLICWSFSLPTRKTCNKFRRYARNLTWFLFLIRTFTFI